MTLDRWLRVNHVMQMDFARSVGVTPTSVSLWCNGHVVPRPKMMAAIAGATEGAVTADDFWRNRRRRRRGYPR
jgi:DNA-binding transcriptional regulator YdaS (Cro superfamily)